MHLREVAVGTKNKSAESVQEDPRSIGLMFIDFLFAFVISKVFELSVTRGLNLVSYSQLLLAATVTTVSWIGYRSSSNRRSYRIAFFNLPILQLSVELTHMYLYWLLAATAERISTVSTSSNSPSLQPESLLLVLIFALYVVWDQIALAMRRSDRYAGLALADDVPRRRIVTMVYLAILSGWTIVIFAVSPRNQLEVAFGDVILIGIVVGHRVSQNYVDRIWGLIYRMISGNRILRWSRSFGKSRIDE
ncbi:MAG TPA: hypothetical protein VJ914_26580 [Pseudonocardiaceae bacterium]|nr:hypothetical protein [Pseudonocardiaceae bacterium]